MTKRLIIARHGNTFLPEQTPTRVGRGTDLPLVEEKRGRSIGKYLLSQNITLDKVYAAPLKRTMKTAQLALEEMKSSLEIIKTDQFLEIDYGVDEDKTEEEVMLRLGTDYIVVNNIVCDSDAEKMVYGKTIIEKWDSQGFVPEGWSVDIESIKKAWQDLANSIEEGESVMICSSNGIIRFAPHILNMLYEQFCADNNIKVATGSVSIFENNDGQWTCKEWNTKAYNLF